MNDSGGNLPRTGDRAALEKSTRERIARAVTRARMVLFWESLWPILAPVLVSAGLVGIVSWLGIWREVSDNVRYGILAAFALAFVFLIFRGRRLSRPARAAALARVEAATGALRRRATQFADRLAAGGNDPTATALWVAHRERLLAALGKLRAGAPTPGLAPRDPFALRFLSAVVFVVAFLVGGSERGERLAEAFRGGEPESVTIARVD